MIATNYEPDIRVIVYLILVLIYLIAKTLGEELKSKTKVM